MSLVASSAVVTKGISVIPNAKTKAKIIFILKLYTPLEFYFTVTRLMESFCSRCENGLPFQCYYKVYEFECGCSYRFVPNIHPNLVCRKNIDW